jgi:sn-glycerol 3-phosphate transport system substrate-binding protein
MEEARMVTALGSTPKIGISVWVSDYRTSDQPEIAGSVASKFNRIHPEYLVDVTSHDARTMPTEVARAAEQGDPPDVAEYHFTATRPALDTLRPDGTQLFTPVERAIAGRSQILGEPVVLGDMVPAARDYFRYAGELTSVARTASTVVLYSNMDLLARAGVAEPPRTWREVTAACRAIAKLSDGPSHCVTWPNYYWFFLQAVAQQGGLLADRDNGRSGRPERVSLATSEMLAFVTWWQRLHRDGHHLYTGKIGDFGSCFAAFEDQHVAFLLTSSVDVTHMLHRGERHGFSVKVSPMPHNDEVPLAGNMMGGASLWLAAGLSKAKQDGALAFIQYLSNPRNAAEWAKLQDRIPTTRAAAELLDREGWFLRNPDLRVASDQLEAANGSPAALGPLLGSHAAIMDQVTAAMHDVLVGDAEPGARFTRATEQGQRILDDYNSYCDGPPRRTPRDLTVA